MLPARAGSIILKKSDAKSRLKHEKHKRNDKLVMMPPKYTDDDINNLRGIEGMIIFNTTTKKHQGFDGTFWNDLY